MNNDRRPDLIRERARVRELRRLAGLASGSAEKTMLPAESGVGGRAARVFQADLRPRKGTRFRMATVGVVGGAKLPPSTAIGRSISDALDPSRAHGKPRSFADMPPDVRERIARELGAPISWRAKT